MSKLSALGPFVVCLSVSLLGCSSDESSTPAPTGVAGSTAGTPAAGAPGVAGAAPGGAAGSAAAGRGAAGAVAVAGSGGSAAPVAGSSGAPAAGSGGGAAGASGAAAGAGGSSGASGAAGAVAGSGGRGGSGGAPAAGSGGSSAGSGGAPAAGSGAPPGNGGTLNETIIVAAGQTYDGGGKRYNAGSALGDGSQSEDQQPMFRVEDGGTLINVVLGSPAADGIHTYGDATLKNIVWEDIGEDALTIKESGTVTLDGGSAANGDDKVFQVNAASTFKISNFKASDAGKFIRQNGGTDFKVDVVIDRCDISNMDEAIFRTDSDSSTVTMTNTRYSNIGDELFMGVNPSNITQNNNTEY